MVLPLALQVRAESNRTSFPTKPPSPAARVHDVGARVSDAKRPLPRMTALCDVTPRCRETAQEGRPTRPTGSRRASGRADSSDCPTPGGPRWRPRNPYAPPTPVLHTAADRSVSGALEGGAAACPEGRERATSRDAAPPCLSGWGRPPAATSHDPVVGGSVLQRCDDGRSAGGKAGSNAGQGPRGRQPARMVGAGAFQIDCLALGCEARRRCWFGCFGKLCARRQDTCGFGKNCPVCDPSAWYRTIPLYVEPMLYFGPTPCRDAYLFGAFRCGDVSLH